MSSIDENTKKRSQDAIVKIAKTTGVDQDAVGKVLDHLGLKTALAKNPDASVESLKVAASQLMQ